MTAILVSARVHRYWLLALSPRAEHVPQLLLDTVGRTESIALSPREPSPQGRGLRVEVRSPGVQPLGRGRA